MADSAAIEQQNKKKKHQKPQLRVVLDTNALYVKDGTWYINPPNFAKKDGRRVFWSSRIEVEVEAGRIANQPGLAKLALDPVGATPQTTPTTALTSLMASIEKTNIALGESLAAFGMKTPTHKGRDIYEVLWSAEVTLSKELKKALIEELRHVELRWPPTS